MYQFKINYKWRYEPGGSLARDIELDGIGATSEKKWGCSTLLDKQIHIVDMVLVVKVACL